MRGLGKKALLAFEEYLLRKNFAAATRENALHKARFFLARCGPLSTLTRQAVDRYRAARASEICASSAASELGRLKLFFMCLVEAEILDFDPLEDVVVGRAHRSRPPLVLSEQAVGEFLQASLVESRRVGGPARARALALRNRACVELLYALGLRASEVREVRVVDLNAGEGTLLVRRAKNGGGSFLPVPKASVVRLEEYLSEGRPHLVRSDGRDGGRLLLTRTGRPLDKGRIGAIVTRVAARVGRRAHPHAFRRSVATHLVRGGVGVVAVKELLGHQRLETTACYVEIDGEDLRRAVLVLERIFAGGGQLSGASELRP